MCNKHQRINKTSVVQIAKECEFIMYLQLCFKYNVFYFLHFPFCHFPLLDINNV